MSLSVVESGMEESRIHKDVSASLKHHTGGGIFHYARVVLDWSADQDGILDACIPSGRMDPDALTCSVYAIGPVGACYTKIGISQNPLERLAAHQVSCWERLTLHHVMFVFDGMAFDVEQAAIGIARLKGIEVRGEWVGLPARDAFRLVLEAAEIVGAQATDCAGLQETKQQIAECRVQSREAIRRREQAEKFSRLGY